MSAVDLVDPARLAALLGHEVRDVVARVERRSGSDLTWVDVHGPDDAAAPTRLLLKVGGRDGDLIVHRLVGADLPAPRVLALGHADSRPYRLTEVVPGPTLAQALSEDGLVRAATTLARSHRLPTAGLPDHDATSWLWDRAREAWPAYLAAADPPHPKRFERLLADPPPRPGPRVLCHGDAHPGNVVLAPDGRTVLVDWEDWRLGPGAEDLAFLLGNLDPGPRTAWARPAVVAYARAMGRPLPDVLDELAAALDQLPKMLPFWFGADPADPAVTLGARRQWDTWLGGLAGLGLG